MALAGFKARNHPQQVAVNGAAVQVDDRGTPPEIFDPLMERFGFTIDVAAAEHNAKCERYITIEMDGLRRSWAHERVWCNPPYSHPHLGLFAAKAWNEWTAKKPAELIVMLVPANRSEQAWWQDHIEPHRDRAGSDLRTEFMRGRQRFIMPGRDEVKPNDRPPFGCCLLIWSRD